MASALDVGEPTFDACDDDLEIPFGIQEDSMLYGNPSRPCLQYSGFIDPIPR